MLLKNSQKYIIHRKLKILSLACETTRCRWQKVHFFLPAAVYRKRNFNFSVFDIENAFYRIFAEVERCLSD